MVCIKRRFGTNPSCAARGGEELAKLLEARIDTSALSGKVHRFPCLGMCERGPNIKVVGGDLYHGVSPQDLEAIISDAMEDA